MKDIKKNASFKSKQKGKDVKFNIDLNYSPEYDSFIIRVKQGEGFMAYSSNIERMPLEVIKKLNNMLEEVLVEADSNYHTKKFDYDFADIGQFSLPDNERNKTEQEYVNLGKKIVKTKFDGDLTKAYDSVVRNKREFGGDFQSGVYADGGYFDGSIPKVNTYMSNYAKGGSLEAHGIEVGDTFVKTISGGIQKVKDKNGKIVYINLSNGERDSQPPLPFANGGGVGIEEDIDMTDDKKLRVRKPAMPEKKLTQQEWAEKHNAGAYEYMGKEKMATGGGVNNGYNVFNYTDNIYATDEVFKTKALANKFIKEFRNRFVNQGYYRDNRMNKINIEDIDLLAIPSDFNPYKKYATGGALVGNQSRIDMNKNGKIDAEDFKLLRSSMNGAWRNERKHVNHSEDYEVRYAKPRPSRTGYKGKRKFEDGGGVSNSERFSKVVAKNYNKK